MDCELVFFIGPLTVRLGDTASWTRASTILGTSLSILFPSRHWITRTRVVHTLDTRASRPPLCLLAIPFVAFPQRQSGCLPKLFLVTRLYLAIQVVSILSKTLALINRSFLWEGLNLMISMTWLRPRSLAQHMSAPRQD